MIIAEEPPLKKTGAARLLPETREKLEWLHAHPGEWLVWCEWRGGQPRAVRSIHYEKRYVRTERKTNKVYVRYMPKPRISEDT